MSGINSETADNRGIRNNIAASMTETVLEPTTFMDFIEFAKSRGRFTRHEIYECCSSGSRRIQRFINKALRYKIIKELEFHNYQFNQDILESYEDFIGWLQRVGRFSLEEVPALDRYRWILQAKREGILQQIDYWTWVKVS